MLETVARPMWLSGMSDDDRVPQEERLTDRRRPPRPQLGRSRLPSTSGSGPDKTATSTGEARDGAIPHRSEEEMVQWVHEAASHHVPHAST
jgi:hypothetical protein